MKRDSFVLYTDIGAVLRKMTNEQKGILFQAIVDYEETGEEPKIEDPIVSIAFIPIRQSLDKNNEKYERAIEQRREAGKRSAELRKRKANEINERSISLNDRSEPLNENQRNQHVYVHDHVNVHVHDHENEHVNGIDNNTPHVPPIEEKPKRETQEKIFERIIEEKNLGIEVETVLREWLKYKSERRETYKETGMKNMITQVQNAVHRFGEVAVMDRIRQAMANTWKGMNLDKMVEQKTTERRMDNVSSMLDRWEVASEEYERRRNDTD